MTDLEAAEANIVNLKRELREAKETLVDKFALSIAPTIMADWYEHGCQYNLSSRIWIFARGIVEARNVQP